MTHLSPIASKWLKLGECFGMPDHLLDEINTNCNTDGEGMEDMLKWWRRRLEDRPTWRMIAKAVCQMGEHELAETLEQMHQSSMSL